jgi:hypothetical protein
MQTYELKMKVVPTSSTALVKLKDTIEFNGGCSMNTPTWRTSCWCLTSKPTEGYLSVFYRLPTEGYNQGGKFR